MNRVPYEILAPHIDRLYEKEFPVGADAAIEAHILDIVAFLHACGWTEEEYIQRYVSEPYGDLTSDLGALHSSNNQAS